MANLDHACTPNLPPSTNIEELSTEQLRRIAIEAVQIRDSWTKGPSPSVHLEQTQTIALSPAANEEYHPIVPPKLSPGGRFLAVFDSFWRLRVIDLLDRGRLVWTYDLHGDVQDEIPVGYDYDLGMLEDGTLVVAYKVLWREDETIHS